jgi:hypothetical protein
VAQGATIPFESDKAEEYFGMVARGLLWHHRAVRLDNGHGVSCSAMTADILKPFLELEQKAGAENTVSASLAAGALEYRGFVVPKNPQISAWLIRFYNGVGLIEETSARSAFAYYAITHENSYLQTMRAQRING